MSYKLTTPWLAVPASLLNMCRNRGVSANAMLLSAHYIGLHYHMNRPCNYYREQALEVLGVTNKTHPSKIPDPSVLIDELIKHRILFMDLNGKIGAGARSLELFGLSDIPQEWIDGVSGNLEVDSLMRSFGL